MRLRLYVTALGAVALIACVAPALADEVLGTKGGTTYVSGKATIISHRRAVVDARCPTGMHVAGGGFGSDTKQLKAKEDRPYDGPDPDRRPDDGWLTVLRARAPDQGVAYAACRRAEPTYEVRADVEDSLRGIFTLRARCPSGTFAWGGGGVESNSVPLIESRPFDSSDAGSTPGDGWLVTFAAPGRQILDRISVRAICGSRAPSYVTGHEGVAPGQTETAEAWCRGHRSVLSAGAQMAGSRANFILHRLALAARRGGGVPSAGAAVTAENNSRTSRRLTAYAICL